MTKTNLVQVVVGGRVLSMSGSGDELHMQRVAACVNKKIQELEETENYREVPADLRSVLVELNLADDLIGAQEQTELLKSDLHLRETELAEVKQALVEAQMKLESLEEEAANGKKEWSLLQENCARLEKEAEEEMENTIRLEEALQTEQKKREELEQELQVEQKKREELEQELQAEQKKREELEQEMKAEKRRTHDHKNGGRQ